ncbi:hypothetical protein SAMN02745163_00569 [Clostridium cavendishii DSM 21758]|uniref:Uncharacterized protein n=1 Tax=Clostridium cavendishii DSM 21758 TaxID=1121302 RepID=A0A1M6CWG9_9CLOT|nr:hypothetical protein [Clostridium cavendishii]SHI65233.1 hypothetical protein SAMN02745163_00569 [Clostridium cavendishii DSM 21758]
MLVKCINNNLCSSITLGKEYLVIEEGDKYFVVVDDVQNEITTKKERFVVIEDNDLTKKAKATINELNYQLENDFTDIKDFKIRKNSKGEIKEIIVKFKYE